MSPTPAARHRRGFTLVEMLVTISIIVLLGGLVLTAVLRSKTTALVIRARGDLGLIESGLDAYRADFGDYPRFVDPAVDQAVPAANIVGSGRWLDYNEFQGPGWDRGARLLCRALIGPAGANLSVDAASSAVSPPKPGDDGADGPGFRVRRTVSGNAGSQVLSGRVFGPYLQPDKWKLSADATLQQTGGGLTPSAQYNAKMLDVYGNPILYYPGTPGGAARITQTGGFVRNADPSSYTPPTSVNYAVFPLYNGFDNYQDYTPPLGTQAKPFLLLDPIQMAYILGDRTGNGGAAKPNGKIDTGETALTTQPYLLWTAGADGYFGFGPDPADPTTTGLDPNTAKTQGKKVDDVCNFDLPADLRK